jgi:hypothetical protein
MACHLAPWIPIEARPQLGNGSTTVTTPSASRRTDQPIGLVEADVEEVPR